MFEILVACIISIRPTTRSRYRLAGAVRGPARPRKSRAPRRRSTRSFISTYHEPKAKTIRNIARRVVEEHGGTLPCDLDTPWTSTASALRKPAGDRVQPTADGGTSTSTA